VQIESSATCNSSPSIGEIRHVSAAHRPHPALKTQLAPRLAGERGAHPQPDVGVPGSNTSLDRHRQRSFVTPSLGDDRSPTVLSASNESQSGIEQAEYRETRDRASKESQDSAGPIGNFESKRAHAGRAHRAGCDMSDRSCEAGVAAR
jgi:hypothetical protein